MRRGTLGRIAALGSMMSAACGPEAPPPPADAEPRTADEVVIEERWISPADTAWDIDTPALWTDGGQGRVLATAKATHDLKVYDSATGALLGALGGPGGDLGRFQRPNAVLVEGDLAFVVERDNRRIQVLRMPSGESAGAFGADVLHRPYGAVLQGSLPELTVWVTDDYEVADPAAPDYTRRLHRFRVRLGPDGRPRVLAHDAFGAADGPGRLTVVESIGLDPEAGRVLVADESRRHYLVYDTLGAHVAGRALAEGRVAGDPEGLALVPCAGGGGYWIVTDQQDRMSYFRLFDRETFSYVGTFRGRRTANTDGVTFARGRVPGFDGPVFFAVHDDQAVSAFAWDDVRTAFAIPETCG